MGGNWKEVVRLRFKGQRFRDHALDLSALGELSQFQKLVAETAKAMWRDANPSRDRLPAHFEERTRLCLRRIEEGSAVAPLEVFIDESDRLPLYEPEPVEVNEAIELARQVFDAVENEAPLPERFPKHLVSEYAKWGQSLAIDEELELQAPKKPLARVSARFRERLEKFAEEPYEAGADVQGEVLEADVRQRRFQLWLDERTCVHVPFDEAQEQMVTTALKDHEVVRLRVRGRGEHSASGRLLRFTQVESVEFVQPAPEAFDAKGGAIEDLLVSIAAEVPKEEWERLPRDLTDDLDHYLYGTPKR